MRGISEVLDSCWTGSLHDEGVGGVRIAREVVSVLIECSGNQGHEQMYACS